MANDGPFHLRSMAASDAAAVKRLWSGRFGGEAATQDRWIEAALRPSHSAVGLVATAHPSGPVVGLSFLDVGDAAFTRQYLGLDVLSRPLSLADRNGIFHLTCVDQDWEGLGIGAAFFERRLDIVADRNVPRTFGIAWHRPHTVDSRVLFEKYEFAAVATIDRYYDRVGGRPHCPDCDGTCSCTASIYSFLQ